MHDVITHVFVRSIEIKVKQQCSALVLHTDVREAVRRAIWELGIVPEFNNSISSRAVLVQDVSRITEEAMALLDSETERDQRLVRRLRQAAFDMPVGQTRDDLRLLIERFKEVAW